MKTFTLTKNKFKKAENQPDYNVSFRLNDTFVQAGGGWIRKDKSGGTFLSCKLGDEYKDHTDETKSRKGWHLEEDKPVEMAKTEDEKKRQGLSSEDVGF